MFTSLANTQRELAPGLLEDLDLRNNESQTEKVLTKLHDYIVKLAKEQNEKPESAALLSAIQNLLLFTSRSVQEGQVAIANTEVGLFGLLLNCPLGEEGIEQLDDALRQSVLESQEKDVPLSESDISDLRTRINQWLDDPIHNESNLCTFYDARTALSIEQKLLQFNHQLLQKLTGAVREQTPSSSEANSDGADSLDEMAATVIREWLQFCYDNGKISLPPQQMSSELTTMVLQQTKRGIEAHEQLIQLIDQLLNF